MRREYPSRPIVGVGAVVVHEGKVILVKRGVEPRKGEWSIPGGGVELGEELRDAVVREVKEECGVEIEVERLLGVAEDIFPDERGRLRFHYVILDFLARLKGGTLRPSEDVTEARWVPLEEVETWDLTRSFRSFFRQYKDELKGL